MSKHINRLEWLEQRANAQPGEKITVIEIRKPREDGSEDVETWQIGEDGLWANKEVKTYLKISSLDSDGSPIVSAYLPDNGRDVSTETDK